MEDRRIGTQIKKARIEANMSQTQLAEKLGVTWEMVSRYENGRSSAKKHLTKLSQILDKSISYFFGVQQEFNIRHAKKIAELLREHGVESSDSSRVKILETISSRPLSKQLEFSTLYYPVPSWVIERYGGVFALRLASVSSKKVEYGKEDIAILSSDFENNNAQFKLLQKPSGALEISDRSTNSLRKTKVHAKLIYIERRFV
jgi:transcriptional regulator with XRE-family HTH domain